MYPVYISVDTSKYNLPANLEMVSVAVVARRSIDSTSLLKYSERTDDYKYFYVIIYMQQINC